VRVSCVLRSCSPAEAADVADVAENRRVRPSDNRKHSKSVGSLIGETPPCHGMHLPAAPPEHERDQRDVDRSLLIGGLHLPHRAEH
jgi:hypothetical protein